VVNNNGSLLKLTPSEINRIAFDVLGDLPEPTLPDRTGPLGFLPAPRAKRGGSKASFEDAKRVLAHFCDCVERGEPVPWRLMRHFSDAVRSYLDGDRLTLDAAFGVKRSERGRPPDETRLIGIAVAFLRLRLKGLTHFKAREKTGWSRNTVDVAWQFHKMEALTLLWAERAHQGLSWTEEEKSRLCKIFKSKNGIVAPRGWKIEHGALVPLNRLTE
jgi:hypothetical protein